MPTPTAHFADVSHYDDAHLDLHAYAAHGAPLIVLKATEGTHYTDPTFLSVLGRIRSVPGLIAASYVFEDAAPAGAQIDHYLSVAHLRSGDLQPIIDAEALGLTRAEVYAAIADLRARGYDPLTYCDLSFFRDTLGSPTDITLWLADYTGSLPDLPDGVKLFAWQHTDRGVCPGVGNPSDMSYLYVPTDKLSDYCIP
jgi:GH25 family lysozyme M1 (1,4-beta-N-acetylmuramidase)